MLRRGRSRGISRGGFADDNCSSRKPYNGGRGGGSRNYSERDSPRSRGEARSPRGGFRGRQRTFESRGGSRGRGRFGEGRSSEGWGDVQISAHADQGARRGSFSSDTGPDVESSVEARKVTVADIEKQRIQLQQTMAQTAMAQNAAGAAAGTSAGVPFNPSAIQLAIMNAMANQQAQANQQAINRHHSTPLGAMGMPTGSTEASEAIRKLVGMRPDLQQARSLDASYQLLLGGAGGQQPLKPGAALSGDQVASSLSQAMDRQRLVETMGHLLSSQAGAVQSVTPSEGIRAMQLPVSASLLADLQASTHPRHDVSQQLSAPQPMSLPIPQAQQMPAGAGMPQGVQPVSQPPELSPILEQPAAEISKGDASDTGPVEATVISTKGLMYGPENSVPSSGDSPAEVGDVQNTEPNLGQA